MIFLDNTTFLNALTEGNREDLKWIGSFSVYSLRGYYRLGYKRFEMQKVESNFMQTEFECVIDTHCVIFGSRESYHIYIYISRITLRSALIL